MDEIQNITDDNRDVSADETIKGCFDLENPKSFFLIQMISCHSSQNNQCLCRIHL